MAEEDSNWLTNHPTFEELREAVDNISEARRNLFDTVEQEASQIIDEAYNEIEDIDPWGKINEVVGQANDTYEIVKEGVRENDFDKISEGWEKSWETLGTARDNAIELINKGRQGAQRITRRSLARTWDRVVDFTDQIGSTAARGAEKVFDTAKDGARKTNRTLAEAVREVRRRVGQVADTAASEAKQKADRAKKLADEALDKWNQSEQILEFTSFENFENDLPEIKDTNKKLNEALEELEKVSGELGVELNLDGIFEDINALSEIEEEEEEIQMLVEPLKPEFNVAPNQDNTLVLEGLSPETGAIKVIEISDVQFRTDSAVPAPIEETSETQSQIPALQAVRRAYLYAEEHQDYQMLVTGHTDSRGRAQHNFDLSYHRARVILALLTGNKEMFKESVEQKNTNEDKQAILKYFHEWNGLNCDPGPVDGVIGDRTSQAIRNYQRGYNRIFNEEIAVDGIWGGQTWGAAFDMYRQELEDMLGEERDDLRSYSAYLNFYPGRQMCACGESIPTDHPGADEYASQTNRRVEILFLRPTAELDFSCCTDSPPFPETVCEQNSCPLYGLDANNEALNNYTIIDDDDVIEQTAVKIIIEDAFGKPVADLNYTLKHSGGVITGTTDSEGLIFHENIPEGTVKIVLENGEIVDFEPPVPDDFEGEDTFGGEETPSGDSVILSSGETPDEEEEILAMGEEEEEEVLAMSSGDSSQSDKAMGPEEEEMLQG